MIKNNWKPPKCPIVGNWISLLEVNWKYTHIIEHYIAVKMTQVDIKILSGKENTGLYI